MCARKKKQVKNVTLIHHQIISLILGKYKKKQNKTKHTHYISKHNTKQLLLSDFSPGRYPGEDL